MSDLQEKSAHIAPDFEPVTDEQISKFFEGADPLERIVSIELPYDSAVAEVIYYDENGVKTMMYKPIIIATWNAIVKDCVHADGFLGYVQGTGKQPSDSQPVTYDRCPDFDDYGLGCFLLAGTEIVKMK